VTFGCRHDSTTAPLEPSVPPPTVVIPPPVSPPTSWKVSGHVLASHNTQAIAGATLILDGIAREKSDDNGAFVLTRRKDRTGPWPSPPTVISIAKHFCGAVKCAETSTSSNQIAIPQRT